MGKGTGTVDLREIGERLSRVSYHGGYLTSLCPFHTDSNPSFFVNESHYNCLSCKAHGPSGRLIRLLNGEVRHYEDSKEIRNPFRGWMEKYGSLTDVMVKAYKVGQQYPIQMSYVRDRGISSQAIKQNRIGWLDGWITFPALNASGDVIGATCRLIEGNARYMVPRGQDENTLLIPDWKKFNYSPRVFLVFGIFDAISMSDAGFPVMTPMTGIGENPAPYENIIKKIHVIPDRGEDQIGAKLVSKMGWKGKLAIPDWPEDCKDINDVWRRNPALLKEMISNLITGNLIKELGF